jgi:hypothetical protein
MIKQNADAIQASTKVLNQLNLSPFAMEMGGLVLLISLFLIPILMVIFMWRIHRDISLLVRR